MIIDEIANIDSISRMCKIMYPWVRKHKAAPIIKRLTHGSISDSPAPHFFLHCGAKEGGMTLHIRASLYDLHISAVRIRSCCSPRRAGSFSRSRRLNQADRKTADCCLIDKISAIPFHFVAGVQRKRPLDHRVTKERKLSVRPCQLIRNCDQ